MALILIVINASFNMPFFSHGKPLICFLKFLKQGISKSPIEISIIHSQHSLSFLSIQIIIYTRKTSTLTLCLLFQIINSRFNKWLYITIICPYFNIRSLMISYVNFTSFLNFNLRYSTAWHIHVLKPQIDLPSGCTASKWLWI